MARLYLNSSLNSIHVIHLKLFRNKKNFLTLDFKLNFYRRNKANLRKNFSKMPIEKPDPPLAGKITHHSIEVIWSHVKDKLPTNQRFKYTLQELEKNKKDWKNVYSGYSVTKVVEPLEPLTDYNFRLIIISSDNEKSEYSSLLTVKTLKEPLTGESLHKAILLDRKADVEKILESPDAPRLLEIPDKFNNLPLMSAVSKNNLEMVELLISKGADVNAQNDQGKNALMMAAFGGKVNIIKELRNSGAKYELVDKSGCTVMHYAVDGGNLDAIQWLLMDGVDANVADNASGWTPLLRAASVGGNKDVAELLIKFKADLNVLDKDNKSALMIAVINGNQPFVQVLVENGADLSIKNEYGKTPYEMAVSMDRRRVVKYLDEYFEKNNTKSH